VGREDRFSVLDLGARRAYTITAVLRHVSPHAYFYVETGQSVSADELERSARELEERIIPAVRRLANPRWDPGAGRDSRLTILHARVPGVAGYFNYTDLLPRTVNRHSNERPMIYINLDAVRPGVQAYYAVLAHEFQHAAQSQADAAEETWVQEGASEYVAKASGYPVGFAGFYLDQPGTQLTAWPEEPSETLAHYGGAYLFMRYLSQRFGPEAVVSLLTSPARGIAGVEAWLRAQSAPSGFEDVFADWAVSNYTETQGGGPTLSLSGATTVRIGAVVERPGRFSGQVRPYAVDYVRVRVQDGLARLTFEGTPRAKLLPADAPSGSHVWWSNRGDSIDSTLTRRIDLTGLSRATLTFRLWHDIERWYDFAYVEASRDGETWEVLPGRHTTTDDPLDQGFGPAYTGKSGGGRSPAWVQETIDLSAYAGGPVWVRFEYITDQGVNSNGLAIDDVAIPEAGLFDDAEAPGAWEARGFIRTDNVVPLRFDVRFIAAGERPAVTSMPLDASNRGAMPLPAGTGGVLVVMAFAQATTEAAPYTYALEPLP